MTRLASSLLLFKAATSAVAAVEDSEFCVSMYADFGRRQLEQFNNTMFEYAEDGAGQKHTPFLTLSEDGATATVVVGNGDDDGGVWHPMTESDDPDQVHWITHIMAKNQDGVIVALEPLDATAEPPAKITFDVPKGTTELTPFEWCNKHGLYEGPAVEVTAPVEEGDGSCDVAPFTESTWMSVHADFLRQQKAFFNSDVAFTEDDGKNAKHTPYITLGDDGTASILVGDEAVAIHPMVGGSENPHWITEIYVVDQDGKIVAMESLSPEGVEKATMTFEVPEGAEELTAYEWCNLHGLYQGPTVTVASVEEDDSGAARSNVLGATVGATLLAAIAV